jgi:hypothetical protein
MGDEGRLYVPPDMVDSYRSDVLPLASILVPNQVGPKSPAFIPKTSGFFIPSLLPYTTSNSDCHCRLWISTV